jgi:hypothetical protein
MEDCGIGDTVLWRACSWCHYEEYPRSGDLGYDNPGIRVYGVFHRQPPPILTDGQRNGSPRQHWKKMKWKILMN